MACSIIVSKRSLYCLCLLLSRVLSLIKFWTRMETCLQRPSTEKDITSVSSGPAKGLQSVKFPYIDNEWGWEQSISRRDWYLSWTGCLVALEWYERNDNEFNLLRKVKFAFWKDPGRGTCSRTCLSELEKYFEQRSSTRWLGWLFRSLLLGWMLVALIGFCFILWRELIDFLWDIFER